uniref:Uncharacterized protein n=1 Tax=Arundo donax TaxID=35708 RepID=A0A0A8Y0W7_ARUDO
MVVFFNPMYASKNIPITKTQFFVPNNIWWCTFFSREQRGSSLLRNIGHAFIPENISPL